MHTTLLKQMARHRLMMAQLSTRSRFPHLSGMVSSTDGLGRFKNKHASSPELKNVWNYAGNTRAYTCTLYLWLFNPYSV